MLGRRFVNYGIEKKMTSLFHGMTHEFAYPIPPLNKNSTFVYDYRLTHDVLIKDGKMDLFFFSEFAPIGTVCGLPYTTK